MWYCSDSKLCLVCFRFVPRSRWFPSAGFKWCTPCPRHAALLWASRGRSSPRPASPRAKLRLRTPKSWRPPPLSEEGEHSGCRRGLPLPSYASKKRASERAPKPSPRCASTPTNWPTGSERGGTALLDCHTPLPRRRKDNLGARRPPPCRHHRPRRRGLSTLEPPDVAPRPRPGRPQTPHKAQRLAKTYRRRATKRREHKICTVYSLFFRSGITHTHTQILWTLIHSHTRLHTLRHAHPTCSRTSIQTHVHKIHVGRCSFERTRARVNVREWGPASFKVVKWYFNNNNNNNSENKNKNPPRVPLLGVSVHFSNPPALWSTSCPALYSASFFDWHLTFWTSDVKWRIILIMMYGCTKTYFYRSENAFFVCVYSSSNGIMLFMMMMMMMKIVTIFDKLYIFYFLFLWWPPFSMSRMLLIAYIGSTYSRHGDVSTIFSIWLHPFTR